MKRLIAFLLTLILSLSLCACGGSTDSGSSDTNDVGDVGTENTATDAATWQEQYDLGVSCLESGDYAEAERAFSAAIEINPEQVDAYFGHAQACLLTEESEANLQLALADYTAAAALDESCEAYQNIGAVQLALNDTAAAEENFRKAIELDSTAAEPYLGLADTLVAIGDTEGALEVLETGKSSALVFDLLSDRFTQLEEGGTGGTYIRISLLALLYGPVEGGYDIPVNIAMSVEETVDCGLPAMQISNVDTNFRFIIDGDPEREYFPDAATYWDMSFDVAGPSNVCYIVQVGSGTHPFDGALLKSIADEAFWKADPSYLMQQTLPFHHELSLIMTIDQRGMDAYCYFFGLDADLNPVAYTALCTLLPA